ncbi:MAG: hypothetical protein LBC74_05030 [Planctomycetaceae bacterium]|jgi:hypothetical protein|nr:hypothetical protein [Planctomycetaceae bacterium]
MRRAIKRQLRIWYADIAGYLSKLRTFHRTALGIIFAIVLIFAARKYWLDPLRAEVNDLTAKYDKSEPPSPLPTIDSDEEITLAKEQLISREKNAETKKREMETVAKSRPKITQQNKEAVLSEFATIITKNKLILVLGGTPDPDDFLPSPTNPAPRKPAAATKTAAKKQTTNTTKNTNKNTTPNTKTNTKKSDPVTKISTQNNESPLKYEEYIYYLEGDFNNVFDFLKQIETFSYPIKVTKLYIGSGETPTNALPTNSKPEKLQLKFNLTLYFHN